MGNLLWVSFQRVIPDPRSLSYDNQNLILKPTMRTSEKLNIGVPPAVCKKFHAAYFYVLSLAK